MPIEELERELGIRGSIKLASNENPLGPSPRALAAVARRARRAPPLSRRLGVLPAARALAERLGVSARRASSSATARTRSSSSSCAPSCARRRGGDGRPGLRHLPHGGAGGGRARRASCRSRDFTHDLEAIAEAVTPRDAARLPRQPEQPDRHDLQARGVGGLPRARCRAHVRRGRRRRLRRVRRGPGLSRHASRAARRRRACRSSRCARSRRSTASRACASATASAPAERRSTRWTACASRST